MISKERFFLVLSCFAIGVLLAVSQNTVTYHEAVVESITHSDNRLIIGIEGSNTPLVVFSNELINIKEGDIILFSGKESLWGGEEQIIVEELWKV